MVHVVQNVCRDQKATPSIAPRIAEFRTLNRRVSPRELPSKHKIRMSWKDGILGHEWHTVKGFHIL